MPTSSSTESVPDETRTVAVCGLGKVGSSLTLAFQEAGLTLAAWDRDSRVRRRASRLLARGSVVATMGQAFAAAPIVILALSDTALSGIDCPPLPRRMVAHTSGIHPASILEGSSGHRLASWHPLRSFPRRFEAPGWSRGTLFTAEGDEDVIRALRRLTRSLSGRFATIDSSAKPLYHAAAALAANHALILAHDAAKLLQEAGMTHSLAHQGLSHLLASACGAFARSGAPGAITGPLRRGDEAAISLHLEALAAVDPDILESYVATATDAVSSGGILGATIPEATRLRIRTLLERFRRTGKGQSRGDLRPRDPFGFPNFAKENERKVD